MKTWLNNWSRAIVAVAGIAAGLAGAPAGAAYPDHPITLVVPYPAGGGVDVVGRLYAQYISEHSGANVVVDNRAGASGTIGVSQVSHSEPNGYRIVIASPANISIAPSTFSQLPYDPVKDLAPIAMGVQMPIILVTPASASFSSVPQLIAYGKSHQGALNYGSGSAGSSLHLSGAMFAQMAGFQATHVPYKGTSPALTDLIAGRLDFMFSDTSAIPMVKGGQLKMLAVASSKRSALLPDTPTVAESGVPGYEAINWYGFFAPADTPAAVVQWLHGQIVAAQNDPGFVAKLNAQLLDAPPKMDSKAFGEFVANDVKKWSGLIKSMNLKFD